MKSAKPKIEFYGFDPSYEFYSNVCNFADKIIWLAPTGSHMKLEIKKLKSSISATCRISSKAGIFRARTNRTDFEACLKSIERKIMSQINRWKKRRFHQINYKDHYVSSNSLAC